MKFIISPEMEPAFDAIPSLEKADRSNVDLIISELRALLVRLGFANEVALSIKHENVPRRHNRDYYFIDLDVSGMTPHIAEVIYLAIKRLLMDKKIRSPFERADHYQIFHTQNEQTLEAHGATNTSAGDYVNIVFDASLVHDPDGKIANAEDGKKFQTHLDLALPIVLDN